MNFHHQCEAAHDKDEPARAEVAGPFLPPWVGIRQGESPLRRDERRLQPLPNRSFAGPWARFGARASLTKRCCSAETEAEERV